MRTNSRPQCAAVYDLTAGNPWNGDCLHLSARMRNGRFGAFPEGATQIAARSRSGVAMRLAPHRGN